MKKDFQGVDTSKAFHYGQVIGGGMVAYANHCGLARLFRDINPKTVVEIGSLTGKSALFMACLNDADIYCVDPFEIMPEQEGIKNEIPYPLWDCFRANVVNAGLQDRIHPIRAFSVDAAREWDHGEIDLVFVDAAHDTDSVIKDIEGWWPLIREGGAICGDDCIAQYWPGVPVGIERVFGKDYSVDAPFWWKVKVD